VTLYVASFRCNASIYRSDREISNKKNQKNRRKKRNVFAGGGEHKSRNAWGQDTIKFKKTTTTARNKRKQKDPGNRPVGQADLLEPNERCLTKSRGQKRESSRSSGDGRRTRGGWIDAPNEIHKKSACVSKMITGRMGIKNIPGGPLGETLQGGNTSSGGPTPKCRQENMMRAYAHQSAKHFEDRNTKNGMR